MSTSRSRKPRCSPVLDLLLGKNAHYLFRVNLAVDDFDVVVTSNGKARETAVHGSCSHHCLRNSDFRGIFLSDKVHHCIVSGIERIKNKHTRQSAVIRVVPSLVGSWHPEHRVRLLLKSGSFDETTAVTNRKLRRHRNHQRKSHNLSSNCPARPVTESPSLKKHAHHAIAIRSWHSLFMTTGFTTKSIWLNCFKTFSDNPAIHKNQR